MWPQAGLSLIVGVIIHSEAPVCTYTFAHMNVHIHAHIFTDIKTHQCIIITLRHLLFNLEMRIFGGSC